MYISYEKYIEKFYVIWILGCECSFVKDLLYIMDVWMDWRRFMALHSSDDFVIALNGCTPLPLLRNIPCLVVVPLGGGAGAWQQTKSGTDCDISIRFYVLISFYYITYLIILIFEKKGNILMWIKQHINTILLLFSVYIFERVNLIITRDKIGRPTIKDTLSGFIHSSIDLLQVRC